MKKLECFTDVNLSPKIIMYIQNIGKRHNLNLSDFVLELEDKYGYEDANSNHLKSCYRKNEKNT